MKKYIGILALFTALGSCDPDTSSSPEPQDVFVKLYGSSGVEEAADIVLGDNGGLVILGTTTSPVFDANDTVPGDRDFFLVFTDSTGNPINQLSFDDGFGGDQEATSLIRTSDGGYVIAGTTTFDVQVNFEGAVLQDLKRGIIMTLDANGMRLETFISTISDLNLDFTQGAMNDDERDSLESVEETRFQNSDFYARISHNTVHNPEGVLVPVEEEISSIIETSDGNLLLIGTTTELEEQKGESIDLSVDITDIWIKKFSKDDFNNVIFEREIGFPTEDRGIAIFERPDRSLVMIANGPGKDGTNGTNDILFVTSDADAFNNNFSEFSSPASGNDIINSAQLLSNGGVAITGATNNGTNAFLLRVSPAGIQQFFTLFTEENDNYPILGTNGHEGVDVTQMNNGNLAVLGRALAVQGDNNTTKGNEVLFFNTDGFGNLLDASSGGFERTYGGNGADAGRALIQLPSGRFVLLSTIDFENNSTMIGLIKTSARGNLIR